MNRQWTLMDRYRDVQQRTGQSPILQAACYQRAAKRDDDMMEFILSMPGIKRDGFDIKQDGWLLDDFRENDVVLWRHSDVHPSDVMGSSPKVWKSTAGGMPLHLRGMLKWATPEQNPQIGPVRAMYEADVLRATSVRWEDDGIDSLEEIGPEELEAAKVDPFVQMYFGGIRFLRSRLVEWSLVPLGMDKQALSVRCQRGELTQEDLARFVATIGNQQLVTDEGREVLVLDGHPVRFATDRPALVYVGRDDGASEDATADADTEEDETVAPTHAAYGDARAYRQALQRYLRGTLSGEGLREHLTAEAGRLKEAGPGEGLRKTYEELHEHLSDAVKAQDEDQAATLRSVIVQVGKKAFGDERLRESWEPRAVPEPASAWVSVGSLLEVGLRTVVADGEERDTLVDTLIASLDAVLGEDLRGARAFVEALRRDLHLDEQADVVMEVRKRLQATPTVAPAPATAPPAVRQDEPEAPMPVDPLIELANHLETKVRGETTSEVSLLKSLLASLPES